MEFSSIIVYFNVLCVHYHHSVYNYSSCESSRVLLSYTFEQKIIQKRMYMILHLASSEKYSKKDQKSLHVIKLIEYRYYVFIHELS